MYMDVHTARTVNDVVFLRMLMLFSLYMYVYKSIMHTTTDRGSMSALFIVYKSNTKAAKGQEICKEFFLQKTNKIFPNF